MNNVSLSDEIRDRGIRSHLMSRRGLDIYNSSFVIYVSLVEHLFGKSAKVRARVTAKFKEMHESFEHISKGWIVFPGKLQCLCTDTSFYIFFTYVLISAKPY